MPLLKQQVGRYHIDIGRCGMSDNETTLHPNNNSIDYKSENALTKDQKLFTYVLIV